MKALQTLTIFQLSCFLIAVLLLAIAVHCIIQKKHSVIKEIVCVFLSFLGVFLTIINPINTPTIFELINSTNEPYEINFIGDVNKVPSAIDFMGNEHKNIICMKDNGDQSSIIIETNKYTSLRFSVYAVQGMDPNDKASVSVTFNDELEPYYVLSAIPNINKYKNIELDISKVKRVEISFGNGMGSTEERTSAILIESLSLM